MDRRKHQIQSKVNEITEEKKLLQSYLDNVISQINSSVDLAIDSKKLKPKDCTLILKYELEVLKKITDMIFELECLIDQSPLDHLKTAIFENDSNMTIKSIQSITEDIPNDAMQESITSHLEISNLSVSVQLEDINSGDSTDIVTENFLSDIDIQELRDTLKKYSEKLRVSPDYMPHPTDPYQRCLSNSLEYYNEPSTSELRRRINSMSIGLEKDEVVVNGFDIPEKDTNKTYDSEPHDQYSDVLLNVGGLSSAANDVGSCPLLQAAHDLNLIKSDQDIRNPQQFCAENGSSSDLSSSVIVTESCSSRDSANGEANHCPIALIDENLIIDDIVDEALVNTEDVGKPDKSSICTAIEKLNNKKIFDRQAEAIAQMDMASKPDISLKPTEHRIKNNLETQDKKSKKKKNKKNKSKENEFFKLVPKTAPGVGMNCAFCHIESPNEFYLHLVDDESLIIDDLTEKLNDMFDGTVSDYNSKEELCNSIGSFCFCYVPSYSSWYRAQIIDWQLESKSEDVVVHFVDYGDKKRISYKNLRRMTKEIAEIPMLAVRCHLALMYPPDSTASERLTTWPAATIDALTDLSGLVQQVGEREKIFRIVYANPEENSVSIDLYNIQDNEEQTVGQILLDLGLAVQIIEEYDEQHAELDMFLQDLDSLEKDNINEAVMGYDPRDEVRICRFTKPDGTCYKGKNCKLEHVPLSKDGFTTDKELIFKEAMYSLTLPSKGSYVNILITAYRDVSNFFAQIIWRPRKETKYIIDEDLYSLLADMNLAKTVRTYEPFKIAPAIGEIVIVKHWSNKCLRAVVREEIVANDGTFKYQVFTLDFGEKINVTLDALWKIKPHFLELPFQAVECYLNNCIARKDCDLKGAKTFFLENLYYHNFAACVLSSSLPLKVSFRTFDGKDIGKMLIEKKFAQETIFDINPAEDCCLDMF